MDSDLQPKAILIYSAIALVILLIFYYYWLRYVLSIRRQLWNQKVMINLLIMIAIKNDVSESELSVIKEKNNNKEAELN